MQAEIVFRQLDAPVPQCWRPGLHWQVECHDGSGNLPFPMGIAWVSDFGTDHPVLTAALDFVLVADQYRREGIATLLVEACCQRWPGIWVAEAVSEDGAALLAFLQARGVPISH